MTPRRSRRQGVKHMAEIAERYGRDIPIWDVVNEELPAPGEPQPVACRAGRLPGVVFQEAGRLCRKRRGC